MCADVCDRFSVRVEDETNVDPPTSSDGVPVVAAVVPHPKRRWGGVGVTGFCPYLLRIVVQEP